MSSKRVAVVGAGLGGLSAAISLAQEGYAVEIFEKNRQVGGKLNELDIEGYRFDLGPSILTLPEHFETLFKRSGQSLRDHCPLRALRPHWRTFFEDGTRIDLVPEPERMAAELERIGEPAENFEAYLKYAADLYDLVDDGYFRAGLDTVGDFRRHYGLWQFTRFDLARTMHQGVARFIRHPHLRDVLDFFIKYVGSSAYDAPAFMNCLPTIQFREDLWYVDGGLYGLARALRSLCETAGVRIHLEAEVARIDVADGRATGVTLADGRAVPAEIVVSNMEVLPAYRRLLGHGARVPRHLRRFAPACSGLVLDLGLDTTYPHLAHHNFFFSGDQRKHFETVFRRKELPEDPTLYVVAASRTDPSVAPAGCDGLKILPHIPCLDEQNPLPESAYRALRDRVVAKLERMGLRDLSRHIVVEHLWTPVDIEREYYSNRGSIYGVVTDRWKNLGFKAPKQCREHPNVFFVGGSVNPGGGMPMVVLCGQNVCRKVVEWDRAQG